MSIRLHVLNTIKKPTMLALVSNLEKISVGPGNPYDGE